jgi:hypothetical protein
MVTSATSVILRRADLNPVPSTGVHAQDRIRLGLDRDGDAQVAFSPR